MTEQLRQSLSAAIDDEADAFELRRVLDELGRDDELRSLWDRYHLIGNALRGEPSHWPGSLRERVWAALDDAAELPEQAHAAVPEEPEAAVEPPATRRSRVGRYTGLAVAASVAFAVVIGLNGIGGSEPVSAPPVAAVQAPLPTQAAGTLPESQVDLAREVSPSDVQRAHAYMLHHAQQQALNQAGVMSFVKLATYEAP